jgi:hypothetical protein
MIVELITAAFVVAGLVAVVVRFQPRDWLGERRWPRLLDTSIGMWLIRRVTGRPTESPAWDWPDAPEPSLDEIADRIGAPRPTLPTRYVVASGTRGDARPRAGPIPPAELVARATAILEGRVASRPVARRRRRPETALSAQRRLAGLAALGVVAMITAVIGLSARHLDGGVLAATATPPPTSEPAAAEPSVTPPAD